MQRGKVIVALVLVGAIGLVIARRLEDPSNGVTADSDAARVQDAPTDVPFDGQLAPQSTSAAQAGASADSAGPGAGEAGEYTIDAAQSEVYWRIYRAGAAARLGHNHVISMTEFDGTLTLGGDLRSAEWGLSFAVDSLQIDDPELRARYGEDFESVPSEDDKAGTKRNMLTDRVLNGELFPEIQLSGTGFSGTLEDATLPLSIEILGRTVDLAFPASIAVAADAVTVTGEFRLTHEDLGMEPFSAFGGIIAVGNEIDFTYRIHAVAGG